MDKIDFNSTSLCMHGVIAVFGGTVHALQKQREGMTKGIWDIIVLGAISSFSGIIFALVSMYLFESEYITLAAAGSGGFLGVEGLAVIAKKIQDLIANKTSR
jgi:hypothetical protein